MIALYFHAQLWSMKDTDVLCLHFAVNYRHLMCQSKHILDKTYLGYVGLFREM